MKETKFGEKKGYVWVSLRWTFYLTFVLNLLMSVGQDSENSIFWILFFMSLYTIVNTFVCSIVHLTKYKQKGFAITALVISSIWVLMLLGGFLMGFLIGLYGAI